MGADAVIRTPLIIGAAVASLATAWLIGRASAPTRTVNTTSVLRVVRTVEVSTKQSQAEQHTEHIEGKERIVTKWRTASAPGCTPTEVVRIEYREAERETKDALLATAESKRELTSTAEQRETAKVVERERPRYAVGVDGGLLFSDATALVRGRFEIRALGPLWITAWGDRYAAGAGARLEW
jgi:hypothetical protein